MVSSKIINSPSNLRFPGDLYGLRGEHMNLVKRISEVFSSAGKEKNEKILWIEVKCIRCGEIIRARIDLQNDLSIEYSSDADETFYICRKTLMGEGRCFQRVETSLTFDKDRNLIDRNINGGEFVSP